LPVGIVLEIKMPVQSLLNPGEVKCPQRLHVGERHLNNCSRALQFARGLESTGGGKSNLTRRQSRFEAWNAHPDQNGAATGIKSEAITGRVRPLHLVRESPSLAICAPWASHTTPVTVSLSRGIPGKIEAAKINAPSAEKVHTLGFGFRLPRLSTGIIPPSVWGMSRPLSQSGVNKLAKSETGGGINGC
jgi:hypothetical protein